LPFPATNPRTPDELIEHYEEELRSWDVDARNIMYAAEADPLDLYRMILTIDEGRRRVFEALGGSLTILSPVGNKALAIGALMAALDRDFPVAYVEAISYTVDFAKMKQQRKRDGEIVHVWLNGQAYPKLS